MSNNKSVLQNDASCQKTNPRPSNHRHYTELNDNELLTLIGTSQDRAALSELYSRYQIPIARFLQRQTSNTKLVEEVYNDVMLTVWQKADSFRGDSKVSTWLFGIAYRTRLTLSRKESRHNHVGNDEIMTNMASNAQAEAETQATVNESLQAALTELSVPHRTVIELTYFHGYSTTEIAEIVGVPQNTVKTRLFHARKNLKMVLEADQAENTESHAPIKPSKAGHENTERHAYFFSGHISFATS